MRSLQHARQSAFLRCSRSISAKYTRWLCASSFCIAQRGWADEGRGNQEILKEKKGGGGQTVNRHVLTFTVKQSIICTTDCLGDCVKSGLGPSLVAESLGVYVA